MNLYEEIKVYLNGLMVQNSLEKEKVNIVTARGLSAEEAIGNPDRKDFPLLKGKEVMIQANFLDAAGQAFTDMPGTFTGTLHDILNLPLASNFERAVLIATLNAVMRHLKLINCTVHCKDKEPQVCAQQLVEYVRQRFGNPRIAFVGLQPAMVDSLARCFSIRVLDLDPDNIGKIKSGVLIEDASNIKEVISWADVILSTGTTMVNDTYRSVLGDKPVVFYGVTVSGIAKIKGYEQYCYCGR